MFSCLVGGGTGGSDRHSDRQWVSRSLVSFFRLRVEWVGSVGGWEWECCSNESLSRLIPISSPLPKMAVPKRSFCFSAVRFFARVSTSFFCAALMSFTFNCSQRAVKKNLPSAGFLDETFFYDGLRLSHKCRFFSTPLSLFLLLKVVVTHSDHFSQTFFSLVFLTPEQKTSSGFLFVGMKIDSVSSRLPPATLRHIKQKKTFFGKKTL